MAILNLFKKKDEEAAVEKTESSRKESLKPVKKEMKKIEDQPVKAADRNKKEMKGKTAQSYRVIIKPLVTEKAAELGALGKYVFAVNPRMNKVEVKKAIRSIYKVDPVQINISNFSGKYVRYGRSWGKTKGWKKAIVTLKPGDKIEVYEGV